MYPIISSLQNQTIKNIQKLEKSAERRSQKLFIVEGTREISIAFLSNFEIVQLYVCFDLVSISSNSYQQIILDSATGFITEITKPVFDKIAYRENSDGLLAVFKPKNLKIEELVLPPNPFILTIEGVEKPGNLGAMLRTADAAKVDVVIICDPKTDIYNPNVIRSSIGCVFSQQIIIADSESVYSFYQKQGIKTFATTPDAVHNYQNVDFTQSCSIIMGTEATGLSDFWLKNSDEKIKIPMRGLIDSLNVSTSAAIFVFEAMRQRGF